VTRPPNVLLLMADQLAATALPSYGNAVADAPNLARLGATAAVFESAYCMSPLCAPSRFSMLAGRLPSRIDAWDNAAELPSATPTVTHTLRAAGYRTVLSGKMHFVGPDQLHGYEERLTTDVYPSNYDWTPDWRLGDDARASWYHNMSSVTGAGIREVAEQTDFDDEACYRAVQWLRHYSLAPTDPFFLTVSFTNPHDPWDVRREYWDRYRTDEMDLPRVPLLDRAEADPHSIRLREMLGVDQDPLTEAQIRRARHGYYGALSYLDARVGEVLDALDRAGLADDTIVVFTADHGEMLGERGLWYKMTFFEDGVRVPLLVRAPGTGPRRVSGPVSHLDLAPTLVELTGVDPGDARFDGSSLVPALTSDGPVARTVAGEYFAEGVRAPMVMLRRGPSKYIRCEGDPDQLFDLDADPLELVNLVGDPARAEELERFRAESAEAWDLPGLARRVLESQRCRRVVGSALGVGLYTPWDHQPFVDASMQYVRPPAAVGGRPGGRYVFGGPLTNPLVLDQGSA
jgi:choline-sulfatase